MFQWGGGEGGVFFRWGTSFLRGGGLGALALVREGA